MGSNQAETFIKATKELSHYIGKKYTMETMMAIKKLRDHVYVRPTVPQTEDTSTGADPGAMRDKTEAELIFMDKEEIEMDLRKFYREINIGNDR